MSTTFDPSAFFCSKAQRLLRERTNGFDLSQLNMLTVPQYEFFVERLALQPRERVLDIGCGFGRIASSLADASGAFIHGFGKEDESTAAAKTLNTPNTRFATGDYDAEFPFTGKFDVIYAIDSLYFTKDLAALIQRLAAHLKPTGRAFIFWTDFVEHSKDRGNLEFDKTRLARELSNNGLAFEATEFTEEEREFWTRVESAIVELEPMFREEHAEEWIEQLQKEVSFMKPLFETDRVRRYAYEARWA